MQVVLHAGAHATDEDRLIKCLLKNREAWQGVAIPPPARYRKLMRDMMQGSARTALAPDAREVFLDAILDDEVPDRLILSNDNFFSNPKLALKGGVFYDRAQGRMAEVCNLFPQDRIDLCLAIRNPATFIPAIFHASPEEDFTAFLAGIDPLTLRWSELVSRLRAALPHVSITLWCNEDTPFIWGELVRRLAGQDHDARVRGGYDLLREIMSQEGMNRFRTFMEENPVMSERQRRRVIAAFLDKFAIDEAIEEEVALPGWDGNLMDRLTAIYEEDLFVIEDTPGVEVIAP